ncbi:response regulator [Xanthovirga aplysinae]|uniref:response regulator n=1 Tax=Xanthovirga aplysinae TaxID=2529853 RepID=UPI001657147C|nr:response regulator [Xanthovirga aplysinae]
MKNKESILVIDDEHKARLALEECISVAGYDVIVASTAPMALELLEELPISLIIADWHLPEINGIELLQRIRRGILNNKSYSDLPFIIITGVYTEAEDLAYAFKLGANDYICKPIHQHKIEIINRIRKALIEDKRYRHSIQQKEKEEEYRNTKVLAYETMIHSFKGKIEEMIAKTPLHKNKLYDLLNEYEKEREKLSNKNLISEEVDSVFPGFLEKLNQFFPVLTKDDLLICSCILLKEGNQTIANRFNMSDESFRKRKTRLKDKLGIQKGNDFYEFLRSFFDTL